MTKYIFFFLSFLLTVSANAADIETPKALVRSVDKVTGHTQTTTLTLGQEAHIGQLSITLDRCLKKPAEEMPENKAFLRISEENGTPIFKGWMFSSNPALSAMEHPIYDIWLLECLTDKPAPQVLPQKAEPSHSPEAEESKTEP